MYLSTFQKPSEAELGYQTMNYIRQKRLPSVKRITLRALLRRYPLPGEHEQIESMTHPEMAVGSSRQRVAQNHAGPEALGRTVRDRRQCRDQVMQRFHEDGTCYVARRTHFSIGGVRPTDPCIHP